MIICLHTYLEGQQLHQFVHRECGTSTATNLLCYFARSSHKSFRRLIYIVFYSLFHHTKLSAQHEQELPPGNWLEKPTPDINALKPIVKRQKPVVARIDFLTPAVSELFFLRSLLQRIPGYWFEDF